MECAVCGNGDELLYTCSRCNEHLCATHHGRTYHPCTPDPDGDWRPPGARDTTAGSRMAIASHADDEPEVDRPAAQLFPDAPSVGGGDGDDADGGHADEANAGDASTIGSDGQRRPSEKLPPDATRPGYGPDRLRPDPVEPADTLGEWFRRQTYVSLSLKVGFVATLWSAFVFSSLAVGLSVFAV